MKREPIIVGIDPGTTLGYAILDVKGNIIETYSSKQHDLGKLIKKVTDKGKVIAVGCDKKNVPSLVEKFSKKVGAKIIKCNHDLFDFFSFLSSFFFSS